MNEFKDWLSSQLQLNTSAARPLVTLAWSQPAGEGGSSPGPAATRFDENRALVHLLRSCHEIVLLGIGTVLAENPALDVTLTEGRNPQPVILDTHLRIPDESHLLQRKAGFPWIVAGAHADSRRCLALEKRGSIVIEADEDERGLIDLGGCLRLIRGMGIRTMLVEGGVKVFTSFLEADLVDLVVVTTTAAGFSGKADRAGNRAGGLFLPRLTDSGSAVIGGDLVSWGRLAVDL